MTNKLRWMTLLLAIVPLVATTAHVVELPNKFLMDGPLWLAVQQRLYYGWGPAIAPFEIGAVLLAWVLAALDHRVLALAAAVPFSLCLVVFFLLNQPVNEAVAGWTAATLPPDWPDYRLRWELGHALSFALWLAGFLALIRALVLGAAARRYGSEMVETEKR